MANRNYYTTEEIPIRSPNKKPRYISATGFHHD